MTATSSLVGRGDLLLEVSFDPPPGWQQRQLPEGSAALIAPEAPGLFTPNLVLSSAAEVVPVVVDAVRRARAELRDVAVLGEGTFEVAGREWFVTEFAYVDAEGRTLFQAVRVTGAPHGGALRVTGTSGSAEIGSHLALLRQVMNSITF